MRLANNPEQMLFILIPIAWLAVLTLFIAVCRIAARGDTLTAPVAEQSPRAVSDGLVVWEDPFEVALQDKRRRKHRGRRLAAHGIPHSIR
jgi:hypothetical protein